MRFEPVWISSADHLSQFQAAYAQTSWLGRAMGRYKMPSNFPCIQMKTARSPRIPIVMFAQGQLDIIEGKSLIFQAVDWPSPAGERLNLLNDLQFKIDSTSILSIEKFERPSPVARYYDMKFTRIKTTHRDVLSDFLLCVGGVGPSMKNIREKSEELQLRILELK